MKKISEKILVLTIILLSILPRLYRIDFPIADWHSWRQSDTASVTREYVKNGIDLLRPRYQDLGNVQSGIDNLEGWRMVEFPFVNAFIAALVSFVPNASVEVTSRLVSIILSTGTALFLYFFVKKISGKEVAFLSAITFALLPFSLFYGRSILPEPAMLFFSTGSLFFFYSYLEEKKKLLKFNYFLASALFLALALLLKPFAAFLGLVYLSLLIVKEGTSIYKRWELLPFLALAFVPLYLWREWIQNFPSGIPASDWLFNSNGIRLRPAWFRWLGYERLTKLILGWWGWIFVLANFLPTKITKKIKQEVLIYGSWTIGILSYLIIISTGNVQHDYYQVFALPIIAIFIGRGVYQLFVKLRNEIHPQAALFVTIVIYGLMLSFAWEYTKGYFNVNHWEYVRAGQKVDELVPADAKVIAPAFSDTVFLYQTNRTGWPIGFEIEDKIEKGATHYVSTSYDDETRYLEKEYETLYKSDEFIIIDLQSRLE